MAETPLYLITQIVQGQQEAEVLANEAFEALEQAMSGNDTFEAAGSGTIALDHKTEAIRMLTEFTGLLTGNKTVEIPSVSKFYYFKNSTTGAFTLRVQTNGGSTSVLLPQGGEFIQVYCDGVDVFDLPVFLDSQNRTLTAAGNLETFDRIVFCDTTGGAFEITLPSTIPIGQKFLIVSAGSTNTLTIGRNTNMINGAASNVTIVTDMQAIEIIGQAADNWLAYRKTLA